MSVLNTGNCEPSLGARRDALGARARLEARALQRQLPDLFLRSPIRPSLVAKRLGIAVHVEEALPTLAVLYVE